MEPRILNNQTHQKVRNSIFLFLIGHSHTNPQA